MRLSYMCTLLVGLGQVGASAQSLRCKSTTGISLAIGFLSFAPTIVSAESSPIDIAPRFGRGGYGPGTDDGDNGGDDASTFFGGGGQDGFDASGQSGFFSQIQKMIKLRNAHGIIMSLVMLILFPIGGLLMRVIGKWWLHAGWQMLSAFVLIAGFGIGVYLANEARMLFHNTHTILGTVVFALFLVAQPVLGFLQHSFFRKQKRRGPAGFMHAWLGRITILLGVVNGGLGLKLAREDGTPRKAYIIVAAVMGALYIITVVITAVLKWRRKPAAVPVAENKVETKVFK